MEKLYSLYSWKPSVTGINKKEASRIWLCLSILVSAQRTFSVSMYAKLLDTKVNLIRAALESLHSIIIVPDTDISIYHASFPGYLATHTNDMPLVHKENAARCFRFMNLELCLGISGAITSHRRNNDQPQPLSISPVRHCGATSFCIQLNRMIWFFEDVQAFLSSKFLYCLVRWVTIMPHAYYLVARMWRCNLSVTPLYGRWGILLLLHLFTYRVISLLRHTVVSCSTLRTLRFTFDLHSLKARDRKTTVWSGNQAVDYQGRKLLASASIEVKQWHC